MRNEVRKQIALAISFFGAAVLVSFPPALRAQNPGGSLLVTVQDSTGARVAGASVSLTQEKFAISRTGKADAQGEKRFESLQPGSYTVTVNVTGFAEKRSEEHTSELQSRLHLVCRLLLEKKNNRHLHL